MGPETATCGEGPTNGKEWDKDKEKYIYMAQSLLVL
jgi:hypothetical protein